MGADRDAGPPGPPGPKGDKGEPGTPATVLWAVVRSNQTLARGSGVTAVGGLNNGQFNVTFNQNIRECTYLATTGAASNSTTSWGTPPEAQANVSFYFAAGNGTDTVRVETYDSAGNVTPVDFHLAVFCGSASASAQALQANRQGSSKPLRKKLEVRRVAAGRKGH